MNSTFFCPQCRTHRNIEADGLGNHFCQSCEESVPHDTPTPLRYEWDFEPTSFDEIDSPFYDLSETS